MPLPAEIYNAEDKQHAQAAAKSFAAVYDAKFSTVATEITDDLDVLLEFSKRCFHDLLTVVANRHPPG